MTHLSTMLAQSGAAQPPGWWELASAMIVGGCCCVAFFKAVEWFITVKLGAGRTADRPAPCPLSPQDVKTLADTHDLLHDTAACQERTADQLEQLGKTTQMLTSALGQHSAIISERHTGMFKNQERIEQKLNEIARDLKRP